MPEAPHTKAAHSAASQTSPMLSVRELQAWYGESHILHGVDLDVYPGEVVTLLGRNGAGKTTTLKAIMGILPQRQGTVRLANQELSKLPSHHIARLGMAFCPEERGIFASLNVQENLLLPPESRLVACPSRPSLRYFPISASACTARAAHCPVASNRCWP